LRRGQALFLGLTILHSIFWAAISAMRAARGKVPGKLSSLIGWAADDIRITGLVHQEPEMVLWLLG
jgi:hypothetical protein